ncbi:MAG: hypothetical protein EXS08_14565 [Planctomycetes bacterium]|nr:hypothetical protein [Planctomycetota bacterium]
MLQVALGLCLVGLLSPSQAAPTPVGVQGQSAPQIFSLPQAVAAIDPRRAGWPSEAFALAAERQLKTLARALERPSAEAEALLDGVFAADFAGRGPGPLAEAFAGASLRIARAAADGTAPALARADFLACLWAPLPGELRAEFQVLRLETRAGEWLSEVHVECAARALQSASTWECRWREDPEHPDAPRLSAVAVLAHEEVRWKADSTQRFADCSAAVFGPNPAWSEQLVPELEAWRARLDARLGLPLLGLAAGIAIADVDGDGLEDVYLCQPGGLANKLFLHRADGTLLDRSAAAGVDFLDVSRAALLLDFDGDGDRDLITSAAGRLLLLANDGAARFWLQGALNAPDATSLAAADVDLDGDLDLYVCSGASPYDHGPLPIPYHEAREGTPDRLFENHGEWLFVEATAERGLEPGAQGYSLAACFEDIDLDGDPDLYVARDFGHGRLYRNDGGTFRRVGPASGVEESSSALGASFGDADGDGRFDLCLSSRSSAVGQRIVRQEGFLPGAAPALRDAYARLARGDLLYRNQGDGTFRALTAPVAGRRAWGALFCDFDSDGWQDLLCPGGLLSGTRGADLESFHWREVVARSPHTAEGEGSSAYAGAWSAFGRLLRSGYACSGSERDAAFLNLGGQGFADVSAAVGFDFAGDARATALCDWDGDGDLDVFLTQRGAPRVRFLRNERDARNAGVTLELVGLRANRDAIGARVELTLAEPGGATRTLLRAVRAGEGCLAQSSPRLTIGLGTARLTRVLVLWPGGAREEFQGVGAGRVWRLVQGSGRAQELVLAKAPPLTTGTVVAWRAPASVRIPLVRPVPLPTLEVAAADGTRLALFGIGAGGEGSGTRRTLLLQLFASDDPSSAGPLAELARHADELVSANLAPLALALDTAAEHARAAAFLEPLGWPFPWATATPRARELLEALPALLLDREESLPLPVSFLIDAAGALRVLYAGPLDVAQVLADRARCELGEGALFDAATPFAGRWMFPELPEDADFFEQRLRVRGLEDAAREFARGRLAVVRSTPADLLQEFGRRSALKGELAEAETFFQRALALDPQHFGALFDWAVVLHRQEKLAQACELYGKALALRPDDVDARFDLALARLALGDREFAERQLRWLQGKKSEAASVLQQALEAFAGPR